MIRREYAGHLSNATSPGEESELEQYVFSSNEKARIRTMSLFVIRSIVEKYGGTMEVDLETDTLHIDVPKEVELDCARDIEEQVGSLCW